MENTVVERALPLRASEDQEPSFPDAQAVVAECVCESTDAFSALQKLMSTVARAAEEIPRLGQAQAHTYVKCLSRIAKGLRRNTEDNHAVRYYYFGQFQTRVDMLLQELEHSRAEAQILSVACRKHFAQIMQLLYTERVCRQQELSDKLKIDRSNLSREMRRLLESGLVEARTAGRFRYYQLTPQGRLYYNKYLAMKSRLEEQVYSPQSEGVSVKDAAPQYFLSRTSDGRGRFSINICYIKRTLANEDIKPRAQVEPVTTLGGITDGSKQQKGDSGHMWQNCGRDGGIQAKVSRLGPSSGSISGAAGSGYFR